jgi:nucleoside-diphosphate-sugar epimerase
MQTILGSGGAIGVELAIALNKFTNEIRLVSRNPQKVNPSDELIAADLLNFDELQKAVNGSSIVYVTIGFAYDHKVWEKVWPKFMKNVINACKKEDCKLVFFDNVYMYDPNHLDEMTEKTPVNPSSKKGKIRAKIAAMIINEVNRGNIKALIARSADFYGPSIDNNTSVLIETVFKPLSKGEKANWLGGADYKHSYTYTIDAAKATALLGNTDKAYGEIWHLPTASKPMTGKEWIESVAHQMDAQPKYRTVSKFLVLMMGLFNPVMKESVEMMYQYNRDYVFDSSKFEKEFSIKPTSYLNGTKKIIETDY